MRPSSASRCARQKRSLRWERVGQRVHSRASWGGGGNSVVSCGVNATQRKVVRMGGGVGSERRTARSGCPTQANAKATAKATATAKAKGKAKAKAMATPAGWKPALRRAILREFVL